jgi:hypothetical protein
MCLTSFGPDLVIPVFHSNPMPLNNELNLDTDALVINRKHKKKNLLMAQTTRPASFGPVVAGVEVGEERKPPNESTGLVGGRRGQHRGGWKEETPQRVLLTRWGWLGPASSWERSGNLPTSQHDSLGVVVAGVEVGGSPPTSQRDSLGVVVTGIEVGEKKNPPTSQRDSLGVVKAGVEVDGRKKPPNESR